MSLTVELQATTRSENVLRRMVEKSKKLLEGERNEKEINNWQVAVLELNDEIRKLEEKARTLEAKFDSFGDEDKIILEPRFVDKMHDVNEIIEQAEDEIVRISREIRLWKMSQQQQHETSGEQLQVPQPFQQQEMATSPNVQHQAVDINQISALLNHFQMPVQKLPIFKGDKWQFDNFWALFLELIDKPIQNKMIKFNHLINSLEGDPKELLNRFKISEENYEPAKQLLIEKYTNKRETIQHLHQSLKELTEKNTKIEAQRKLYEKILAIIRQLESRNQDINNWLIQEVIATKFSHSIQRSVHRAKATSDLANNTLNNGELETTEDLLKRINNAITIEESISSKMKNLDTEDVSNVNSVNIRNEDNNRNTNHSKRVTNQSNRFNQPIGPNSCVFCQMNNHTANECKKFKTVAARKTIIKEKRLCFNCLGNHQKRICKARGRCFNCNGFHHTSICERNNGNSNQYNFGGQVQRNQQFNPNRGHSLGQQQYVESRGGNVTVKSNISNGRQSNDQSQEKMRNQNVRRTNLATVGEDVDESEEMESSVQNFQGTRETVNHSTSNNTKGFLPVVSCKAFNEKTKEWDPMNILLDTGADNTHVRSSLAKQLNLQTSGERKILLQTFGNEEPIPMTKKTTSISLLANKEVIHITAMVMDQLTGVIPSANFSEEDWKYITEKNIILHSRNLEEKWINPDIVVGTDVLCKIWKGGMQKLPSGIHVIDTIFGHWPRQTLTQKFWTS